MVIRGSRVRRNFGFFGGGGIWNDGILVVMNSLIQANTESDSTGVDGGGGGLWNRGTLTVRDSLVGRNRASRGGGIRNQGRLTMRGVTVRRNTAHGTGGGIWNSGPLFVWESSVHRNRARRRGGGIYHEGSGIVSVDAISTVSNNVPDDCYGTTAC
jgi:hypothetical protein